MRHNYMRASNNKPAKKQRPQKSSAHRLRSVRLVLAGNSTVKIGKKYGDSPSAVGQWVKRFKTGGKNALEDTPKPGRPSTLTGAQEARLKKMVAEAYRAGKTMSGGIIATLIKKHFRVTLTRRQGERILKRFLTPKMKYLGYGSNLLTERLRARVSSASNPILFPMSGWILKFHKRSNDDGSGKCNLVKSESENDLVYGVIFDVAEIQITALDRAEGEGYGYTRETWKLDIAGVTHGVTIYLADSEYIDDSLKPFDWYRDLVLAGAEQHSLPSNYITKIKEVPFTADTNLKRPAQLAARAALKAYERSKSKNE